MTKQIKTYCRICEPACPLIASVDDSGEINALEPNLNHPAKGVACHKGLSYIDLHHDPDRVNYPLKRKNSKTEEVGSFERISWDQATSEVASTLKGLIDKHGPNAVAIWNGNPGVFNARAMTYGGAFTQMLGTQMVFSANTQDMSNRMTAVSGLYGGLSVMVPDLLHTEYLICMGANPRVSKWTVVSAVNDSGKTMEDIKNRGGKIRFVNPRITESSTPETGDTLLIKPGSDVYFLAALLNEIEKIKGLDEAHIEKWGTQVEKALDFVRQYPAERVSQVTGISVEEIKNTASDFVAANGAGIYISVGVNQSRQGVLAAWLADLICFLTGNLGKKGGMYKPNGFLDFGPPMPLNAHKVQTSIGELTYTAPGPIPLPAVALPELIENGDIKALIVLSGNPIQSASGEHKLRQAIGKLDLLVSVDILRNATAEISDYILPACDFLERADINFLSQGMQPVPFAQYTDKVVEPKFERRGDWKIMLDIAKAMGVFPGDDPEGWGIINKILSMSDLSIEKLSKLPEQIHFFDKKPYDDLYHRCIKHQDGKVHCFPNEFEEAGLFERCESIFSELQDENEGTLKMISMRTTYMHNTWFANMKKFRRGSQSFNPLHMSSHDAERLQLTEGEAVRVFNQYGSIETHVHIDDQLRTGAVAMTHGYGKGRSGMRIAEQNPGANPNQLVPNTMDTVEPVSNMTWIGAYPVEVESLVK
jgi:anaerobic selenocysteine-containing dehydrogenase